MSDELNADFDVIKNGRWYIVVGRFMEDGYTDHTTVFGTYRWRWLAIHRRDSLRRHYP